MAIKVLLQFRKRNTGEYLSIIRHMQATPSEGDLVVMNKDDDCGVVEAVVWGLDGVPVVSVAVTPNVILKVDD